MSFIWAQWSVDKNLGRAGWLDNGSNLDRFLLRFGVHDGLWF